MRILLVEDDAMMVPSLIKKLTDQHYTVDHAIDGQVGWAMAENFAYDLILLDVMLPKLDGISFCQRLRSQGSQTPILLLTAQDTSINKVLGLDAGADDYLAKPFDWQELLARIRALLRRGQATLPPQLVWRNLQLDPNTCAVTCNGQPLHLTPKEYGILDLLLRNPQRIFSCSALIDHLWALEATPIDETVRSHIKGLRQKLKLAGILEDPIVTIYGIGYRLKAVDPIKRPRTMALSSKRRSADIVEISTHPGSVHPPAAAEPRTGKASTTQLQRANASATPACHPPPSSPHATRLVEGLAHIWESVKDQVSQRLTVIEQATTLWLQDQLEADLRQQAYQEAHKLAGSLGTFGLEEGSRLAKQIESGLAPDSQLAPSQVPILRQWVQALRQEVFTLHPTVAAFGSDQVTRPSTAPQSNQATLLAVDDDPHLLTTLQQLLQPWGFRVFTLQQPQHLLATLATVRPDLLILDVEIAPIDGIKLCQQVRQQPQWYGLPILFLTDHPDTKTMHRVFAAGADDSVSKPIVAPELLTRILNRLERSRLVRHLTETDILTGLYNRRKSTQELQNLLQKADQHPHPLCLAWLDIDQLKHINYQHGPATADEVLAQFGQLLHRTFTPQQVVGRWGGTEFVVGMPDFSPLEGQIWCTNLLDHWHQIEFTSPDGLPFHVTCSAAVVPYPEAGANLQSLYQVADTTLAQVKAAGGNQVYTAP
jgi:diguanylate cyclase (GGDEF)-like protein